MDTKKQYLLDTAESCLYELTFTATPCTWPVEEQAIPNPSREKGIGHKTLTLDLKLLGEQLLGEEEPVLSKNVDPG